MDIPVEADFRGQKAVEFGFFNVKTCKVQYLVHQELGARAFRRLLAELVSTLPDLAGDGYSDRDFAFFLENPGNTWMHSAATESSSSPEGLARVLANACQAFSRKYRNTAAASSSRACSASCTLAA